MKFVEDHHSNLPYSFTADSDDELACMELGDGEDGRLKYCLAINRPAISDDEPHFEAEDYMLRPEVNRWLETMVKDRWDFEGFDGNISFRNKSDAMAFKMAWLT